MAELNAPPYEVVIENRPGLLRLDLRELWEYRDLLVLLVRRDFLARYQQTLLGPAWHLLQPVLTTLVFALIFGRFAKIPTDGIPAPLFYFCGLLGWNYFAQNVISGSGTFLNNQQLFAKVWFPRAIVPISTIASNLVTVALQLIPFIAFFAYYKFFSADAGLVHLTWHALLTPLVFLHLAVLSLGLTLWISASTARYRDMIHLTQYVVQLWMFATPIIYPLSQVPERWAWLIRANPVSAPVEALRWCLLGRGSFDPIAITVSLAVTLVLLLTGIIAFQQAARSAVDTV